MGGFIKLRGINNANTLQLCPLIDINDYRFDTSYVSKGGIKAVKNTKKKAQSFGNYSNILFIPEMDTSSVTSFSQYFIGCRKLLAVPNLDTSMGTNFYSMFNGCKSLIKIPQLDTSNGTRFENMFDGCESLTYIPQLNTSNGTSFNYMFNNCSSLTEISEIDLSKATTTKASTSNMFAKCSSLKKIESLIFNSNPTTSIKNIFGNQWSVPLEIIVIEGTIKVNSNDLVLSICSKLTVDSLMSFINAFEDNTGEETQYTVTFGATNLAKLTPDQIAVATAKNILLA